MKKQNSIYNSKKKRYCMLNPMTRRRVLWDCLLTIACFYIAVVLPFAAAWDKAFTQGVVTTFRNIDTAISCAFVADIILNFRTGFFTPHGDLIMDEKEVAKNYLTSWFFLDVISCVPFDELTSGYVFDLNALKLLKLGK